MLAVKNPAKQKISPADITSAFHPVGAAFKPRHICDLRLLLVEYQSKSLVRHSREGGNPQEKETWIPDPRIESGTGKSWMTIGILSDLVGLKEVLFQKSEIRNLKSEM